MLSSSPANTQAQALLQTFCKFMLPLIQTAAGQALDPNNIHFGIEADEFVIELEKFISGMILCSQSRNEDITIEAKLETDSFHHSKEAVQETIDGSVNDRNNQEYIPGTFQSIIQHHCAAPQSMTLGANEKDLAFGLQDLRKYVNQRMPIRLLFFEPHDSKLKISLFERADIYNYLTLKLRADYIGTPISDMDDWIYKHAGYAILSHTWTQTPGELTYSDWKNGSLSAAQPKCWKLINFCKSVHQNHELTLGWIDTVCINKESSAELDESIRSMYVWYRDARVCITYLAGSETIQQMHNDPWFTRGWTLQELVAPQCIKFYNSDWNELSRDGDDKENPSIQLEINIATTITSDELRNIWGTSISRRMQLVAKREVTRGEDIAYCLMGIFDVSISTAYGEGADRAFSRLVEEIFRSTKDVSDIFNWAGDEPSARQPTSLLFPSRPSDYLNRSSNSLLRPWHPIEPLTVTHLGLRTPILLMPAVPLRASDSWSGSWYSPFAPPIGDYHAVVHVQPLPDDPQESYLLLDKRVSDPKGMHKITTLYNEVIKVTVTFGTLNVEEERTSIRIPKTCLAVLLEQQVEPSPSGYEKVYTKEPIVFNLKKIRDISNVDEDNDYYQIDRSRLAKHGMQLVTLYL